MGEAPFFVPIVIWQGRMQIFESTVPECCQSDHNSTENAMVTIIILSTLYFLSTLNPSIIQLIATKSVKCN